MKTLDGREQENFYDGEGLRAGLTENGKKTTFLYHNGEILTECDGDSAPIRRYLRGIGLSHVQTQDNAVENFYQYDAFGNLLEKHEDVGNRILYTGQQYDQETGQYYLRARYYNPVVGRFLQEDAYRGDGLNLYAHCANNPVVYYDPTGHAKVLGQLCKLLAEATQEDIPGEQANANPINTLPENQGYSSLGQLKNAVGSAGEGRDWHHIVEQSQVEKSGFAPEMINNTSNIISIEHTTHMKIGGYYSAKYHGFTNGLSVRDWLAGKSYEEQYQFGLNILRKFVEIQ